MYTVDGEILMLKREILRLREQLLSYDINDPNNRFKIPSTKDELRILETKIEKLKEEQKTLSKKR